MERKFNTEGPMLPQRHYCIPPLSRIDLDEVLDLIEDMKYFVLHAPRQTGKISILQSLAETLVSSGRYRCVYVNVEGAQTAGEDVARAMRTVLSQLAERAETMLQDGFVRSVWMSLLENHGGESALNVTLGRWAKAANRPLVLLIDEIDTLRGDSLLALLRQLRMGCDQRPHAFPQSVILCGVRDTPAAPAGLRRPVPAALTVGPAGPGQARLVRVSRHARSEVGDPTREKGDQTHPAETHTKKECACESIVAAGRHQHSVS